MEVSRRAIVVLRVARSSLERGRVCFEASVQSTIAMLGIATSELMLAQTVVRESEKTMHIEGQIVVIALAIQFLMESPRVKGNSLLKGINATSLAIDATIRDLEIVHRPPLRRYAGP